MLELDVLLGNFLNEAYSSCSFEEQKIFADLLNYTDPELFAWLLGHEVPADKNIAHITEQIRHHARARI